MRKLPHKIGNKATSQPPALPAGCFGSWLRRTRSALKKNRGVLVPCGDCTACCRSSYFIHIKPEEIKTLSRIPRKFLAAAPGLPQGHKVLGYFQNGNCPMLMAGKCSIYAQRPLTCRSFDCRIFAAAGVPAWDNRQALINRRVRRWKFQYPARRDREQHSALRAAAKYLRGHVADFPAGTVPGNPSRLAVLAIKVYGVFLKRSAQPKKNQCRSSDPETVKAILEAYRKFERI